MLALIGYGLLGIVVAVGVVALLVLVLPGDHLGAAPRDVVPAGLPSRPDIGGDDVARVRLPVTLRGYRMVDTDAVLDRLALELERRDREIDDLRRSAGLPPRAADAPLFAGGAGDAPSLTGGGSDRERSGGDEVLAGPALDFVREDTNRPYASDDDAPSHPTARGLPAGDPQHEAAADGAGSAR
jgi:hypothetical protein